MVMVMTGGEINQRIFYSLNEVYSQEQLSAAAAAITTAAQRVAAGHSLRNPPKT
jgi:cellobiose-specific phosphotransferase system component IIA